ncbi:septal ring lytic transglycosylase RlpA family protein [Halopseudomonas sp.]|uniref:septal ring lytic transglycosylase RlpA family protein n=1 Tax=Halopseudomonas sp. TaxID=2901191 RepID=UPI003562F39A
MNKPVERSARYLTAVCLFALLAGCSSTSQQPSGTGGTTQSRPAVDGAPDYLMDVSGIPDAVPVVHQGAFKASPYRVLGKNYTPMQDGRRYREEGEASWYGTKFHGQKTANGEVYDLYGMTAAHKTLPLPTYVQVTNLANDRKVMVRVNDRGPFYSSRIIDLSYAAAKKLGFAEKGTARVLVEGIDPVVWHQQKDPGYLVTAQAAEPQAAPQYASRSGPADDGVFLQVGAFSSIQAAEQLRAQLQNQTASPVFLSTTETNARTLHRVRIGPLSSQDQAQQLADLLRRANLGTPALISGN